MNKPLISIACISYNHDRYIEQAINSWLNQIVDCDFEIVIGDDKSTDNTLQIIQLFKDKYPEKIKVLDNSSNLGVMRNFARTLNSCSGSYIAICEGDDYWPDNQKLQLQLDVLRANPNIALCFTNAEILYEDTKNTKLVFTNKIEQQFSFKEYLNNYSPIPTASMFFKNVISKHSFDHFYDFLSGDYVLRFILGDHGDFYYLNKVTAVYRKHEQGVSKAYANSKHIENGFKLNSILDKEYNHKYSFFLRRHNYPQYEKLVYAYIREKSYFRAMRNFPNALFATKYKLRSISEIIVLIKSCIKLSITRS